LSPTIRKSSSSPAHRDLLGADLGVVVLGPEPGDGDVLLEVGGAGDGTALGVADLDERVLVPVDRERGVERAVPDLQSDVLGALHRRVVEVLVEGVAQDGEDDRRADKERAGDDEARRRSEPGPDAGRPGEAAPERVLSAIGVETVPDQPDGLDRVATERRRRSSCAGSRRRPRRC
jgi:hypothetical protein